MRHGLLCLLALLGLLAPAGPPQANAQGPAQRPAVSPFLNLNRRGTSPALNYYNLVRPEVEFRNSAQQLQQQITNNQQAISGLQAAQGLRATGQRAQFMTHTRFFMTLGGQGAAARNAVAGPVTRPLGAVGRPPSTAAGPR